MPRIMGLLAVLVATSGCHTYQPISVEELTPGQSIRARVTGAFSDSLAPILQKEDAREFEGVVVEGEASSVLVDVPVDASLRGMRFETLNQRVEIPRAAFTDVEAKELHTGRTVAAAGIVAGALAGFAIIQFTKESGGSNRPGTPGPVDAVVSIDWLGLPLQGLRWVFGGG